MKALYWFAENDLTNIDRFDEFEGSTLRWTDPRNKLTFSHPITSFSGSLDGCKLTYRPPRSEMPNVFCMYMIKNIADDGTIEVAQNNLGDYAIFITDGGKFLDRFVQAAESGGLKYAGGCVEYTDFDSINGNTGPFCKPLRFSHQSEFRLAVWPVQDPFRTLILGSLEDITTDVIPRWSALRIVPNIDNPKVGDLQAVFSQ